MKSIIAASVFGIVFYATYVGSSLFHISLEPGQHWRRVAQSSLEWASIFTIKYLNLLILSIGCALIFGLYHPDVVEARSIKMADGTIFRLGVLFVLAYTGAFILSEAENKPNDADK